MKEYRAKFNMSQTQLAKKLNISRAAVGMYESRSSRPSWEMLDKMAVIFNTTIDNLVGRTEEPLYKKNRINVYSHVRAGLPEEMVANVVDWEDIPEDWLVGGKEYFGLKVSGHSMEPKYIDGDTVIVQKQNACTTGQDCIVAINGETATLKKVLIREDGILLQPHNSAFDPVFYTKKQVEEYPGVSILGVVVELRRKV